MWNGVEGLESTCPSNANQRISKAVKARFSPQAFDWIQCSSGGSVQFMVVPWGGIFLRWHQRLASSARGLSFTRSFGKGSGEFYLAILPFYHLLLRSLAPLSQVELLHVVLIQGQHFCKGPFGGCAEGITETWWDALSCIGYNKDWRRADSPHKVIILINGMLPLRDDDPISLQYG